MRYPIKIYCINSVFKIKRDSHIIFQKEPYLVKHLAVNGNDLLEYGIKGNAIGKTLDELKKAVIETPSLNTRETLLKRIKGRKTDAD